MSTKVCFKCEEEKDLSEFYKQSGMANGHLGKCKECTKTDVRVNRAMRLEQYQEYDQRRGQTAKRKAQKLEWVRSYRARYPIRHKVSNKFNYALKIGRIVPPDVCEKCGETGEKIVGHHDVYDLENPLDVQWLCHSCHRRLHGQAATNNIEYAEVASISSE